MASDQTNYRLAETMEERVAVGMQKFYRLWQEAHGPGTLPDIQSCARFIKPFVWKESLVHAHGHLHRISDEVTIKRDRTIAHDIMLNNASVDERLLLDRL
jgi:hypothetical protein